MWRRQAVHLLGRIGREGPWHGKLLAAVAAKAVEIEGGLNSHGLIEVLPEHIRKRDRLHGCGMEAEDTGLRPEDTLMVMFSQCLDMNRMVNGNISWEDKSNWLIWHEVLTF